MRLLCDPPPYEQVSDFLFQLSAMTDQLKPNEIKYLLKGAVPEYQPQLNQNGNGAVRLDKAIASGNGHDKRNGKRPGANIGIDGEHPNRGMPKRDETIRTQP